MTGRSASISMRPFREIMNQLGFIVGGVCCVAGACGMADTPRPGKPVLIPTQYKEGRFFAEPVTLGGTKLHLYTDSGGGLFLFRAVAEQLHLKEIENAAGDTEASEVILPVFKRGATIPPPLGNESRMPLMAGSERPPGTEEWSGMLGQQWFAGRVWTWDYPRQRLLWRTAGDLPKVPQEHKVELGFQTNPNGSRKLNFPRIQIQLDGETLDMLFDTGAFTELNGATMACVADGRSAKRAASFITQSVFEGWHKKHPEWRVCERAEKSTGATMIEVKQLQVAGYVVGPVWFTVRPDKNFHEYMSQWMDRKVEGALGASGLQFFRVTVDYPGAVAAFER